MVLLACYIKRRRMVSDGTARQQRGECLSVRPVQQRQTLSQVFPQYGETKIVYLYSISQTFLFFICKHEFIIFVLTCFSFSYKRPLKLDEILKLHQLLLATINSFNECVKLIMSFSTPTTCYRASYFKTSMNRLSLG